MAKKFVQCSYNFPSKFVQYCTNILTIVRTLLPLYEHIREWGLKRFFGLQPLNNLENFERNNIHDTRPRDARTWHVNKHNSAGSCMTKYTWNSDETGYAARFDRDCIFKLIVACWHRAVEGNGVHFYFQEYHLHLSPCLNPGLPVAESKKKLCYFNPSNQRNLKGRKCVETYCAQVGRQELKTLISESSTKQMWWVCLSTCLSATFNFPVPIHVSKQQQCPYTMIRTYCSFFNIQLAPQQKKYFSFWTVPGFPRCDILS